ncbi:MAG: hypothetical protein KDN22_06030 [Verrucomicrobiae bacterium]|nr:hypothetical protein [Verrucomicrobiae bacterium]
MIRSKFAAPVFIVLTTLSLFCNHGHSQSVVAYQIDEGVVGNQEFGGALGMDFIVNSTITVDSLGAFDSDSDGFNLPITVELWSRDDFETPDDFSDDDGLEILASAEFEEGETGTAMGGSRFLTLAEPVVLEPGAYTIVGVGYGPGESNYNVGDRNAAAEGLTVADTDLITFVGSSRFGDAGAGPGAFPFSPDGGPVNRYGAGSFTFILLDSDGDGAPDSWEEENGLNKDDAADGAMDLDGDGLSNVEEYNRGTDPSETDTDADGLSDSAETETDPRNPDTDGDGLKDGVETDTGTFVSAADTGTDPTVGDTDGDGFKDGREVDEGSDPTDVGSTPGKVLEVAYQIDEGVIGNQAHSGALGMDFIVDKPLQVIELGAFDSGSDGFILPITVELWSRDDGGTPDDGADDSGAEILASLEFEEGETGTLVGGSRFLPLGVPVVLTPGAYTIVAWGYGGGEENYNLNGGFGEDAGLFLSDLDFITFIGSGRFGDAGANGEFPTSVDGGPENRYGAGTFKYTTTDDTDGDGIPDLVEDSLGLDKSNPADAALDPDSDGLTNKQEYERGTDIAKADTDGDGLSDGIETNTGTWLNESDRGTDPLNADSDADGLADGVENNSGVYVSAADPGTSPVKSDTDGDGSSDAREIAKGTNPIDPNSFPPVEISGEVAINVEEGRTGNQAFSGGLGMDFIVHRPIRILELGAFDDGSDGFNAEITVELWSRDDAETPEDIGDDAGIDIMASIVFTPDDQGDLLGGYQFRDLDSPLILEPGAYTIVGWGYNGEEMNGNDGNLGNFPTELTESDAIEFIGTSRFGATGGDFPTSVDGGPEIRYGAGSFTFDEGTSVPFQITDIALDQAGRSVTLTWSSSPGATYAVSYSTDLEQWIELEDGLPSDGEITEFTEENVPADSPWRYYRVRSE